LLFRDDTSRLPEENHELPRLKPQNEHERDESSHLIGKGDPVVNSSPGFLPKFKNGSLELSLKFEDSSISPADAYRISKDLNNVFSHLNASFVENGDQKRLVFKGEGRHWPDILDPLRMPREIDGTQSLYIPQVVSDAYKQAFDFIEQHKIEESEVSALLAELESGRSDTESIAVLSTGAVPAKKLAEVLKELAKGQIKSPSVLAYKILDVNNLRAVFAETPFLKFEDDGVIYSVVVGVVRVGNKWKIAL
jgi:hypothetical protein